MARVKVLFVFGNMHKSFPSMSDFISRLPTEFEITLQYGFHDLVKMPIPNAFYSIDFFKRGDYLELIIKSDIVCGHAGVGFITDALSFNKMPVVMPRSKSKGEHTNDHQLDFAARYCKDGIFELLDGDLSQESNLITLLASLNKKPSRKFITDLSIIKDKIHSDVEAFLNN